jgi:hypothetical protein
MKYARNVADKEPGLGLRLSRHSRDLTETSKAATLHLAQCAASTDECDRTDSSHSGEDLE